MLIAAQRPCQSPYRAIFLISALCIIYFSFQPVRDVLRRHANNNAASDGFGTTDDDQLALGRDTVRFWADLFDEIRRAEPAAASITEYQQANRSRFDPKLTRLKTEAYQLPDLIALPDRDRESLKHSHYDYVSGVRSLSHRLPFNKTSRGVVMTAGGSHVGIAITSILMLRQTGSELPVHLFVDRHTKSSRRACRETLANMNVRCFDFDFLFRSTPAMAKPTKFQYKVFSILFSPLQDVLFLDADAFPISNPEYLFDRDPYTSHGLVVWPDFWLPTISPLFYNITDSPAPALDRKSRSAESGIMLYDKAVHADSLLLAAYYNFYGPRYYYPLLSQGADGQGDKETFLQGALALGNPAYRVRSEIAVVGRKVRPGVFEPAALRQADPAEDWRLHGSGKKRGGGRLHHHRPTQTGAEAEAEETEAEGEARLEEGRADGGLRARSLFIHHNQVKIDIQSLDSTFNAILRRNPGGRLMKLWGDQKNLTETAGYDVERAMWTEIIKATCRESLAAQACGILKEYFTTVFDTTTGREI